jgi:thiamine biosynthesis lipoprotein
MDLLLSPRRRLLLQGLSAAALAAGCGDAARAPRTANPQAVFRGPTMGSTYTVKLAGVPSDSTAAAAARRAVESALQDVVARMSTYDAGSELSRFNAHAGTAPFTLSPMTAAVLAQAAQVSQASAGAFDVTVAPLVDAWGFGPRKAQRVPRDADLRAAGQAVGWRRIELDVAAGTAAKAHPAVRANLSGIAKGFAVDRAAAALDALGMADYLVEAGGEVRARGRNADGLPWQVAVERPDALPQRAHLVVPLSGQSMATSGDYRIFFEEEGRRYCHEIDPATGRPIVSALASVSVVSADCSYADAMSTALIVLGPERGFALAAAAGIAAHFIVRGADGTLHDRSTAAFAALGGRAVT